MAKVAFCLLTLTLTSWGCGGSLTGPDIPPPRTEPTADTATISGRIYASDAPLYTPIAGAVVEVNEADGASGTVVSDADGFYRITVPRGSVTITASRDGYEAKQWQFDLLNDLVLNFSLSPQ